MHKKMQKEKKDRRIHTSTMRFIGIAAVIGAFILMFSFAHAWGEYEKQIEDRASADVFETIDLEDFDGQTFTRDDLSGTKLVAYNIWETT